MISPRQFERSKKLRTDVNWTRTIRELYPPAAHANVVVAYDPEFMGGRWVLAYDTTDHVLCGGIFSNVRYLKAFYVWQGPGDTFLLPSTTIADWLRDHDTHSERHVGEWEDRQFGGQERADQLTDESHWDNVEYEMKHLYDRYKDGIHQNVGSFSHHNGKGPNNGSKYFMPSSLYTGWKS